MAFAKNEEAFLHHTGVHYGNQENLLVLKTIEVVVGRTTDNLFTIFNEIHESEAFKIDAIFRLKENGTLKQWSLQNVGRLGIFVNESKVGKENEVSLQDSDTLRFGSTKQFCFRFQTQSPLQSTSNSDEPAGENVSAYSSHGSGGNDTFAKKSVLIKSLLEKSQCVICTEVFITPVTRSCGHVFCDYCIRTWERDHSSCPTCRTSKTGPLSRCYYIEDIIQVLVEEMNVEDRRVRENTIRERDQLQRGANVEATNVPHQEIQQQHVDQPIDIEIEAERVRRQRAYQHRLYYEDREAYVNVAEQPHHFNHAVGAGNTGTLFARLMRRFLEVRQAHAEVYGLEIPDLTEQIRLASDLYHLRQERLAEQ